MWKGLKRITVVVLLGLTLAVGVAQPQRTVFLSTPGITANPGGGNTGNG